MFTIDSLLRKMPVFKGKQRIARLLFKKSKISKICDVIVKGKFGCTYKIPNLKENIGFELYVNGIYEEALVNFMIDIIPTNGYVLDIGANIGAISLPVCKKRADIFMICMEASLGVYDYLQWNKEKNELKNCILINRAITDKDNEIVEFYSPVEWFGKGSLSSVFTEESEKVETATLDTILDNYKVNKIDFIKIDIEGYEYYAFKGGAKLLCREDAPDIVFEFVDWAENYAKNLKAGDAQAILIQYGYKLYILSNNGKKIPLHSPLVSGSVMILATKKTL